MENKIKELEERVQQLEELFIDSCYVDKFKNQWLNIEQTAKALGISKRTLSTYRKKKLLGYSSIKGKFYFKIQDIEEMLMKFYIPAERTRKNNRYIPIRK